LIASVVAIPVIFANTPRNWWRSDLTSSWLRCASSSDTTVREIKYQILQLFSLRPSELIQGFSMQDPNLSEVSLRFFNVVLYYVQLFPGCNLASMIQLQGPRCEMRHKRQRHFAFVFRRLLT